MPTNSDFTPDTIESAVNHLVDNLSDAERQVILEQPPEANHFTGGMALRNNWGLWNKETAIKKDAVKTYGIANADDLSGLIMAWAWAKVRGDAFDAQEHCKVYHEHWKCCGITSLEAGGYNEDKTPK